MGKSVGRKKNLGKGKTVNGYATYEQSFNPLFKGCKHGRPCSQRSGEGWAYRLSVPLRKSPRTW